MLECPRACLPAKLYALEVRDMTLFGIVVAQPSALVPVLCCHVFECVCGVGVGVGLGGWVECSHQYLVPAERGKSCDKACEKEGLSCEQSSAEFGKINSCDALKEVSLSLVVSTVPLVLASLSSLLLFFHRSLLCALPPSIPFPATSRVCFSFCL
jgi:hypothetical protein